MFILLRRNSRTGTRSLPSVSKELSSGFISTRAAEMQDNESINNTVVPSIAVPTRCQSPGDEHHDIRLRLPRGSLEGLSCRDPLVESDFAADATEIVALKAVTALSAYRIIGDQGLVGSVQHHGANRADT